MNEVKHTPGPWEAWFSDDRKSIVQSDTGCGGDWTIATVYKEGPRKHEARANAKLIAAAPDLLDALIEARRILETASRYFPKSIKNSDRFSLLNVLANAVNPAIEKAKGEKT